MIFVLLAIFNGMLSVINKMVNVQAKRHLGMLNGTLINYLEGTLLSLLLIVLLGKSNELNPTILSAIPPIYFIGGVAGLLAMLFAIKGMDNTEVILSTVLILIGQLGMGFVIDSFVKKDLTFLKFMGIILIIIGIALNQYHMKKQKMDSQYRYPIS